MELTNKGNTPKVRKKQNDLSSLGMAKMSPQAPQIEAAVLGAIMLEPNALHDIMDIIKSPEYFYSDANQRIFGAIQIMYSRTTQIDFMTVSEQLRKTSELEMAGGAYYVTNLTRDVGSSANIEEHARIIAEKYIMRELIMMGGAIITDAYEDGTDVFDLLDKADATFTAISESTTKAPYKAIRYKLNEVLEQIDELRKNPGQLTGVATGFDILDSITSGWQKTDLIILAARPAVGKTAFALNLAMNGAKHLTQEGKSVAVFSLEMGIDQLQKRMLATISEVGLTNINKGIITDDEATRLERAASKLSHIPIIIDDNATLNIREIKSKARRLKRKENVGMIIIDYLQLMSGTGKGGNREAVVAEISRGLKILAKELEIPIVALSQLNRNVESRKEKEPNLADIRESGAIEQDADMVMFLYRWDNWTRLKIAKHRNGKTDNVDFKVNMDIQLFSEKTDDPRMSYTGHKPTENSGETPPPITPSSNYKEDGEPLPF